MNAPACSISTAQIIKAHRSWYETTREDCTRRRSATTIEARLESKLDRNDYCKVARLSHAAAEKTHAASKQKHISKLKLLMDRKKRKSIELRPEGHTCWVVNLSGKTLTSSQEELLKLGLNFAPVPTKYLLQDTIAGVEEAARQLPKDDATDLRSQVCGILRSSKLPKDNIMREHRSALKEMRGWTEEVILPADKGNATVVMTRSDYNGKLQQLLSDPTTYRKLPKDPTPTQEAKVSRVLKD